MFSLPKSSIRRRESPLAELPAQERFGACNKFPESTRVPKRVPSGSLKYSPGNRWIRLMKRSPTRAPFIVL
jgi:hypothetical protein